MKLKKDKDTILLENAYSIISEGQYMNLSKVAKAGILGSHGNYGMQNTANDMADNSNPHPVSDSITSNKPAPHEEESRPDFIKAQHAFAKAVTEHGNKKKVDIYTVSDIAKHRDVAKRYARYLIDKGIEIPKIIKNATEKKDQTNELNFPVSGI
jgi:hypothetical protein